MCIRDRYDTCRHLRFIRDNYFSSYHLSGIVIDSFVYNAIGDWRWLNSGESSTQPSGTYEQVLLDYYNRHTVSYTHLDVYKRQEGCSWQSIFKNSVTITDY